MSFRIAILSSSRGSTLDKVLKAWASGALEDVEFSKVLSNVPGCGAIQVAHAHGIPSWELSSQESDRELFDDLLLKAIGQVDLVLCMGYFRILSPKFLAAFPGKVLNAHPSLLPKYSGPGWLGLKVHEAVLANEDAETGVSLHEVTAVVDGGPILLQKKLPVLAEDTPESLQERVQAEEATAFLEAIYLMQAKKLAKLPPYV